MTTAAAPVEQLDRALTATEHLITSVTSDQWNRETPCPGWTVRDLVNHLVTGNLAFTALLREHTPPDRAVDHLGDDPTTAYHQAAAALREAFTQPGVLDRIYQAPIGPAPGIALLHLRITEHLVHGWDLAHATGQPADLPEDLAEIELAGTRAQLGDAPRTGHPFGPAQPATDDAPAIDRLAAYLGRTTAGTQ